MNEEHIKIGDTMQNLIISSNPLHENSIHLPLSSTFNATNL